MLRRVLLGPGQSAAELRVVGIGHKAPPCRALFDLIDHGTRLQRSEPRMSCIKRPTHVRVLLARMGASRRGEHEGQNGSGTLATKIAAELGSTRWDENGQRTISGPKKPDNPGRFGMSRYAPGRPPPNYKTAVLLPLGQPDPRTQIGARAHRIRLL
jgi:hypothetical protein